MSIPTIIDTLCEISGQLHGIHSSIKRQTELLVRMTEKPKEAAPAPKAITWQEAARVLAGAAKGHCKTCELQKVCAGNFRRCAEDWEVPADE